MPELKRHQNLCACGNAKTRSAGRCWQCAGVTDKGFAVSPIRTCVVCGAEFQRCVRPSSIASGKEAGLACSRDCGWKLKSQRAQQKRLDRCFGESTDIRFGSCVGCRQVVTIKAASNKTARHPNCKELGRWRSRMVARAASLKRFGSPVLVKKCEECGSDFDTACDRSKGLRGLHVRFCSDKCIRRGIKRTRRARERGAGTAVPIAKQVILQVHGAVCHLCGDAIDLRLSPGHPDSFTMDHVVPLARGGSHEADNIRPAHLYCNGIKSDHEDWAMRTFHRPTAIRQTSLWA